MAINKLNSGVTNTPITPKQLEQGRPNQQAAATNAPRQDAVSLTQQAQQLSNLQRRAQNDTGVDQFKVERIKLALANGDYSIDAERLAARIASFEFDLFGTGTEQTGTEQRDTGAKDKA